MNRRSNRIQLESTSSSSWTAALWPQCNCCFQAPGVIRLSDDEDQADMPRHAAHPRTFFFGQQHDMEFEALLSDDEEIDQHLLEDDHSWLENDAELVPVDRINRLLKVNQELSTMVPNDASAESETRPQRESLPQPYIIHPGAHMNQPIIPSSPTLMSEENGLQDALDDPAPALASTISMDLPALLVDVGSDQIESDSEALLVAPEEPYISSESHIESTAEEVEEEEEEEAKLEVQDIREEDDDNELFPYLEATAVPSKKSLVDISDSVPEALIETTIDEELVQDKVPSAILDMTSTNDDSTIPTTEISPAYSLLEQQESESQPKMISEPSTSNDATPSNPRNSQQPTIPAGRRTSVAQVAQSYLGDKLEDLTEKLTFIKKNIIMSLEEDDEDDEEEFAQHMQTLHPSRSQQLGAKSMSKPQAMPSEAPVAQRPLRKSSLPKSTPPPTQISQDYTQTPQSSRPSIERFNSFQEEASASFSRMFSKITSGNGSGNGNGNGNGNSNDRTSFSPSSFFAALAGTDEEEDEQKTPRSPIPTNEQSRPIPSRTSSRSASMIEQRQSDIRSDVRSAEQRAKALRRPGARTGVNMFEDEQQGEEVVFDFGKVLEMGRTFGKSLGEDVVQNGLKMFNDVSDRMKNVKRRGSEENWLGRDSWL